MPKWTKTENMTFWLCETCKNHVDPDNNVIKKIQTQYTIQFPSRLKGDMLDKTWRTVKSTVL